MTRRNVLGAVATAATAFVSIPRSVFASQVRWIDTRLMRNLLPVTEQGISANFGPHTLEDPVAFHDMAERMRLTILDELRKHVEPVNVWRIGQFRSDPVLTIWPVPGNIRTNYGGYTPEKLRELRLKLRVRAGVE